MNSLRRDIHSAFEVIEPPLGGMPERVVQTVLAEKNGRLRKERMVYRVRISLALVAAVLLVAVGAAAVMTWNSLHNSNISPAGQELTQIQQLEARSLHIPKPKTVADCQTGPFDSTGGGFGSGPMYAQGGPATPTAWGNYFAIYAYAKAPVHGPVLVRAIHLFDPRPVVFIGPNAAGSVVGTDTLNGQSVNQHSEAIITDPTVSAKNPGAPWGIPTGSVHFFWPMMSGEALDTVGGSGWQIDGSNFSETFVVC